MDSKDYVTCGKIRFDHVQGYRYRHVGVCRLELDADARELWDTVSNKVELDGVQVLDDPETASAKLSDKIAFYMNDRAHIENKFPDKKPTAKMVYEAAGISKSSWGRIKSGSLLDVERGNVFALALALRLDEDQTADLLRSAGFCINYELELDCAVMYFIRKGEYNMNKIRRILGQFSNIRNGFDCFTFRPQTEDQMPKNNQ